MSPFVLSLLVALGAGARDVEWISHRGESADAPENTLAAFQLSWERDVAAIELDVHRTADDRLLVCHDADLKRTASEPLAIKSTAADALTKLDVGRWKAAKFAGEKPPLLDEVLAALPDGRRCYIEMKVGPEAVPALVRCVEQAKLPAARLPIISFNAATCAEAKRKLPDHSVYLISGFKQDKPTGAWKPTIDDLIAEAKQIHADGLDLAYNGPLDAAGAAKIRAAKLGLYVWTVDKSADAKRMLDLGVDGITSNRAAALRDEVK